MATQNKNKDLKTKALIETGTLNRSAEKVADPKFHKDEFFDPRDLVQVKYELLRRVQLEKTPVTQAVEQYGLSRPTYYQTQACFQQEGIAGLVPKKRGPRGPHKLNREVISFLQRQLVEGEPMRARALAKQVKKQFGVEVHPRTIERVLRGRKKNSR